jgi:hypothetical protein
MSGWISFESIATKIVQQLEQQRVEREIIRITPGTMKTANKNDEEHHKKGVLIHFLGVICK